MKKWLLIACLSAFCASSAHAQYVQSNKHETEKAQAYHEIQKTQETQEVQETQETESDRPTGIFSITYLTDFKDGIKGFYGLSCDGYGPHHIGLSISTFGNWGMYDSDYNIWNMYMGPNLSGFLADDLVICCPVQCGISYGPYGYDTKKYKVKREVKFALLCDPFISIVLDSCQLRLGGYVSYAAVDDAEASFGFQVGIGF